jgi:predicted N-formylglutamate amidohydrolase
MSPRAGTATTIGHAPYRLLNPAGAGNFVVICDHASNAVPAELGDLGLGAADLQRHIAWDIGAAGVTELVAKRFDAPAVLCGTSRLVVDCNRYPDDPTAIPEVSDGTRIPANESLPAEIRNARVRRYFDPYHAAIAEAIEAALAAGRRPVILAIHSMTPEMGGRFRPWQITVSSGADRRLADPMLAALRRVAGIAVGDNQPYALDPAEDYSVPVHAVRRGLLHLQIEFRQDEISSLAGIARWAAIFNEALELTLASV